MMAISKAGHDKGKLYYILKEDGDFVYLADGDIRTADKPKKKNRKHINIVKDSEEPQNNEQIKLLIKKSCKRMKDKEDVNV